MTLRFSGMPGALAVAYRDGAADANGQAPERHVSDGDGVPCRHCLGYVARGEAYLILGYRPFPGPQPYAEVGPVFIHAEECPEYQPTATLPVREQKPREVLLRGYGRDDRIVYGSGIVVPSVSVEAQAEVMLSRDEIAYVHMRSSTNNCFTLRIDRG